MTYIPVTGITVFNPEWIKLVLSADITLTESVESIVTSSGSTIAASGSYGTNVGYDGTNKRPYAVTDGTFLILAQIAIGVVHSAASDIHRSSRITKNGFSIVDQGETEYISGGVGKTKTLSFAQIVTAVANDYFTLGATANQITGGFTSASVTTGGANQTSMQVIYLGA